MINAGTFPIASQFGPTGVIQSLSIWNMLYSSTKTLFLVLLFSWFCTRLRPSSLPRFAPLKNVSQTTSTLCSIRFGYMVSRWRAFTITRCHTLQSTTLGACDCFSTQYTDYTDTLRCYNGFCQHTLPALLLWSGTVLMFISLLPMLQFVSVSKCSYILIQCYAFQLADQDIWGIQ